MGSTSSYSRSQKKLFGWCVAVFNRILPSWGSGSSQPDHNRRRDVDTSPYSGIEKSQHGFCTWHKRSEKGEGQKIGWQVNDHCFLDSQEVLLISYVLKGVNVNSVYYCKVLHKLNTDIHHKRSYLRNEQIFLIHNNAHPHFSVLDDILLRA